MLMAEGKKTGTVPIILGMLLLVAAAAAYVIVPGLFRPTVSLQLGDGLFRANVAMNDADRAVTFSGAGANSNRALLKIFPADGKWALNVSAINKPIDVIWLGKDKKVVFVVKDASSDMAVDDYAPKVMARYIIEAPSGTVDSKAISIGSLAYFELDEGLVK